MARKVQAWKRQPSFIIMRIRISDELCNSKLVANKIQIYPISFYRRMATLRSIGARHELFSLYTSICIVPRVFSAHRRVMVLLKAIALLASIFTSNPSLEARRDFFLCGKQVMVSPGLAPHEIRVRANLPVNVERFDLHESDMHSLWLDCGEFSDHSIPTSSKWLIVSSGNIHSFKFAEQYLLFCLKM